MNPEVKKIFVLSDELIQNQSDNILLPPCLKLPNSNSISRQTEGQVNINIFWRLRICLS